MNSKRDNVNRTRSNVNSPKLGHKGQTMRSQRSYSVENSSENDFDANGSKGLLLNKPTMTAKPEVKYYVGESEECDFKTITEALERAQPGTIIKIDEGRYRESIRITKNNIRIEPRSKDKVVYLLGEEGPSITVDLRSHETCIIKGIIIAHFGSNIANKFNEQIKENDLDNANPTFLTRFEISKEMDCAVCVLGGNAIIRNSLVTLKSLPDNIKSYIPALIAMPGTRANLVSTDFRGNENIMTAGFISLNSDVLISDCKFHNFKAGGVFVSGNCDSNIKVADSKISQCGVVGLYSQGEDCKPLLLRLKIESIEGPAIKIYKANRAKVKGCDITKCQAGIEAICSDPFIVLNKIYKNFENGIITISKGDLRCEAMIKFNEIIKNKDNGILCSGKENRTKILKNITISNNRRAGIKAIDGAHVSIFDNLIKSNFCQGILLVEGTSGHIEHNNIHLNFKANIAFGGMQSSDTVIIKNKIYSSRSEGIFILETGFALLYRNEIYDNNDGIIMYDSHCNLNENIIRDNLRTGVIVSGASFPKIENNEIYSNTTAGAMIRDNSECYMNKNKIYENYYQLSIRNMPKWRIKKIVANNAIDGPNETPNKYCPIF
ncbi:unnamed protein product [Moneuplotes crassus]|uniref:Right handed beta helix domain-containing protein n=2 Tax=Euplotes crassus TaxID=5936 RepID=A0AAD1X9Q3_EUPCR|nr:unnamed protein product [Moneuplotes crassus]